MSDPSFSFLDALAPSRWPTLVVVGARFIGLMLTAPLWSMPEMPRSLRGAMVVLFTLAVLPTTSNAKLAPDYAGLPGLLGTELLLGVGIGLTGAVLMAGVALAGEVASLQMGLNLGPSLANMPESPVAGVGELKSMLAMAIYVTLGGHLMLLTGVARSLQEIPPGAALDVVSGGRTVAALVGTLFTTAVRVAAPIMVALLLTNLGIAILGRAVPQINSMVVAFPITIGLGFIALGASLPFMGRVMGEWVTSIPRLVSSIVSAFAPLGR